MTSEIKIRQINQLAEFKELRKEWNTLALQRETRTTFLSWEWLFAWWRTHSSGKDLWLITAWRGNELVGIAPLMLVREKKYGLRFRLLESLGTPNSDEGDFLCKHDDPEVLFAICDHILRNKKQWDAIRFHEHLGTRASTRFIKSAFGAGGFHVWVRSNIHYHIPIDKPWDAYYKSLSRNVRQNLERRLRRTREEHQISFEFHRGADVQWKDFEAIFKINKNGSFPEKYESETERAFHRELLDLMAGQNMIEMAFLVLDGEPVAFEYGFNANGHYEDWRTGYNLNFGRQSIGKALLYYLLQELFKEGYADFDFLRGEYSHKQDWQPEGREYNDILVVKRYHIPAYIALIAVPKLWQWMKMQFPRKAGSLMKSPAK